MSTAAYEIGPAPAPDDTAPDDKTPDEQIPVGDLLTIRQAAALYGIAYATLHSRMGDGKLPFRKLGKQCYVTHADMERQPKVDHKKFPNKHKKQTTAITRANNDHAATQKEKPADVIEHGSAIDERDVAYCFGRIEKEIEIYADGLGVSKAEFAKLVGQLLSRQTRRVRLGSGN